jgi:hypothetical protein
LLSRRKFGGGPAGLKVDPNKGLRSPLVMDGGVKEGCVLRCDGGMW